MTMRKMAALPGGGFVLPPPLEKEEAEEILGQGIPPDAWRDIRAAFAAFGRRARALDASKASRSKGDPQSWHGRQDSAVKAIEAAMEKVRDAKGRHGEFLREASDLYTLQRFGYTLTSSFNARRLLEEAHEKLLNAVAIIERAEAMEIETPTPATSRQILAQDIRLAFLAHDVDARLSDRRKLPDDAAEADLTPFEQMLSALGVHEGETPAAVAKWIGRAIANPKRGDAAP